MGGQSRQIYVFSYLESQGIIHIKLQIITQRVDILIVSSNFRLSAFIASSLNLFFFKESKSFSLSLTVRDRRGKGQVCDLICRCF